MTLSDDIKDAEQRAREAVVKAAGRLGQYHRWVESRVEYESALDRYAAVSRLAGRWTQMLAYGEQPQFVQDNMRVSLAQLMEG